MCYICEQLEANAQREAEEKELDDLFGLNVVEPVPDASGDSSGFTGEVGRGGLYNEGVSFVMQQGNDLETLRRLLRLQEDLEVHIRELRGAVDSIVGLKDSLNLSASPLKRGAMPEWYEVTTHATGNLLQQVIGNLEYVADRLQKDYDG